MSSLFPEIAPPEVKNAGYARVAVERGVDKYPDGLTYAIPLSMEHLVPGTRVIVPLGRGNSETPGYVIDITTVTDFDPRRIKPIKRCDQAAAVLPTQLISLARWISRYYFAPVGMVLAAMLPGSIKKQSGMAQRTLIAPLTPHPDPSEITAKLSPGQKKILTTLHQIPPERLPIEQHELAQLAGTKTLGPIRKLLEKELITKTLRSAVEHVWPAQAVDRTVPARLTAQQEKVIADIAETLSGGFAPHLLFGVTGSGKTEVYIRLIQQVLQQGKTSLMLVPEIALTPQTGGRLIGRFPDHRVAILHSGLTAAQRREQWLLVSSGKAQVVMGARSAVFAPIPDDRLGLIIVDEEHDNSYKQDSLPRYHGRDVAIRRAQLANCPVVLGSATPSLESWLNATEKSAYALHELPERAPGLTLPKVWIRDIMAENRERKDRKIHLIGPMLERCLGETLESSGSALLLLNRRGYANYIACPSTHCGWVLTCDECDVTMVKHVGEGTKAQRHEGTREVEIAGIQNLSSCPTKGWVECHHCLARQRMPQVCPDCKRKVSVFGLGTQRVEGELQLKFPGELISGATMLRIDSDTMNKAKDFHEALHKFNTGEVRLLLGTQMIAKGLDNPRVKLVGVINADTAINLPDFRARERTFQLVAQVTGRCGRGSGGGKVVIQTMNPRDPAITCAAEHDYKSFAQLELEERRRCGLPPVTRMARIVVRDEDHRKATAGAREVEQRLREYAAGNSGGKRIRIRPAAPCPISRIAGKHRWQIELMAPTAKELLGLLDRARAEGAIRSDAGMAVDVDPQAML